MTIATPTNATVCADQVEERAKRKTDITEIAFRDSGLELIYNGVSYFSKSYWTVRDYRKGTLEAGLIGEVSATWWAQ